MSGPIAFIGMGEAGGAIVSGWDAARRGGVAAYDIKSDDTRTAAEIARRCAELGIRVASSPRDAVAGARLVLCTVTADQAVAAARAAAAHLLRGAFWFDLNACAPAKKREAAAIIEAASARYVDVAVMAPVYAKRNLVPLLVSGRQAREGAQLLADLPMSARVVAGGAGAAASVKLIRSVMVKGLEALAAECALAAAAAGVTDEVFRSLQESHPGTDWKARAAYSLERAVTHGERRAAEMEDAARTLAGLGLPSDMAEAAVCWHSRLAGTGRAMRRPAQGRVLEATAAELLQALGRPAPRDASR